MLRFTYALSNREVTAPASVLMNAWANGSSICHAVTESNDLRVIIEPTPCTDVMSGKPFEKTVTVTFNKQSYRACVDLVK